MSKSKNIEVKVKPVAPVIESAYYYIGALGIDKSHPMTKEADGVYSVTVPAKGEWHWFKIAPESGLTGLMKVIAFALQPMTVKPPKASL